MAKPSSIIVILLFVILLLVTTPSSYSNNQTDLEALLAFKKAIHNDPLGALSSWNETTQFCRWNGIWCSKRHQNRVVSVSLPSQGLLGSLSPHIGNLSFLIYINLQNNTFRGLIPPEMGRLRRLEFLEFSNNSLVGGISRNLTQCINLYHLSLKDNQLTGSIVPEIASLVNLEHLGLSSNLLSSTSQPTTEGSSSRAIKEYGMNNVVSTEGDAYSYGILLLEMFTNIRPTSGAFVNLQDFIITASSPHRVMEAVDPFLHLEIPRNDKYQACFGSKNWSELLEAISERSDVDGRSCD